CPARLRGELLDEGLTITQPIQYIHGPTSPADRRTRCALALVKIAQERDRPSGERDAKYDPGVSMQEGPRAVHGSPDIAGARAVLQPKLCDGQHRHCDK